MSSPRDGGRQEADIGQDRIAPADAGVMVEKGDALGLEEVAQAVPGGPSRRGSDRPRKSSPARARKPALSSAESTAIACIRVCAGAAGFRDRDEARGNKRQGARGGRRRSEGRGCRGNAPRGASAKRPRPGTGVVRELRQRLAAEARSAGAEEDDVVAPSRSRAAGGADRVEVVGSCPAGQGAAGARPRRPRRGAWRRSRRRPAPRRAPSAATRPRRCSRRARDRSTVAGPCSLRQIFRRRTIREARNGG